MEGAVKRTGAVTLFIFKRTHGPRFYFAEIIDWVSFYCHFINLVVKQREY